MKLASVLAGATAVALALTATAASAGNVIDRGAAAGSVNINIPFVGSLNISGSTSNTNTVNLAQTAQTYSLLPGNIALFTMDSNGFAGDSANLTPTVGATFSLKGEVSQDCAYYTGGTDTTVDFGTIGINTSDNNPNGAFQMVGNDRTLEINSNLAGCNTKNTVKFSKTDLTASAAGGFDPAQFTNVIPVELQAKFTAGVPGATSGISGQTVNITAAGNQALENPYGAWKSPLNMTVRMKNPNKGLVAGSYTGSVGVTIAVAQ